MTIVCAYFGPPGECPECGGQNLTGAQFCSHDCYDSWDERKEQNAAREQARRDNEAAFGLEVQRLLAEGYSYEECDQLLAGWKT